MKRCPACARVYDDVDLKFCPDDGAELGLSTASEAPPTEVMHGSDETPPETIEAPAPAVASSRPEIPATVAAPPAAPSVLVPLVVTAVVLFIVGGVILAAALLVPSRDTILGFFLGRIAIRVPMLGLVLGGSVFAILRWRLHPRASLMTLVAFGIYLVDMVVYTMVLYWLPSIVEPLRMSRSGERWFYSLVYFIDDIVAAVTIILLVAAAFADRQPRPVSKNIT